MFAYYRTKGIRLSDRLDEIYKKYGFCLNTLHSYEFEGAAGFEKMQEIMETFHKGLENVGGKKIHTVLDYSKGLDGLPKSDVLKYLLEDHCSVVVRPSGTEPKLKLYISVSAEDRNAAQAVEKKIVEELAEFFV
jgi:phosphoglucomutase